MLIRRLSVLAGRETLFRCQFFSGTSKSVHQPVERKGSNVRRWAAAVGFGLTAYAGYQCWQYDYGKAAVYVQQGDVQLSPSTLRIYSMLPLNTFSRAWGWVNSIHLPVSLRSPLLGLYSRTFGCNLDEAKIEDLRSYRNLQEFFIRRLKPDCRPINLKYCLTSPSDGTVVHFGRVSVDRVEQIKGVTYSLKLFLGGSPRPSAPPSLGESTSSSMEKVYQMNPGRELYQCVIYLAPGDYHRFHSPTDWVISTRRYFQGLLLSVRPSIIRRIPDLFAVQERAVYLGQWRHGFFSMSLVGAYNVGSITIYKDPALVCNSGTACDCPCDYVPSTPITLKKGEDFGHFNLGSTIVLIFEAPKNFNFVVESGQLIKYGQPLGM